MVQANRRKMKYFLLISILCFVLPDARTSQPSIRLTEILNSGDGCSPQTAFKVYNIAEEYQTLYLLNLPSEKQILLYFDGRKYDVFEFGEVKIYFQIVEKPSLTL